MVYQFVLQPLRITFCQRMSQKYPIHPTHQQLPIQHGLAHLTEELDQACLFFLHANLFPSFSGQRPDEIITRQSFISDTSLVYEGAVFHACRQLHYFL